MDLWKRGENHYGGRRKAPRCIDLIERITINSILSSATPFLVYRETDKSTLPPFNFHPFLSHRNLSYLPNLSRVALICEHEFRNSRNKCFEKEIHYRFRFSNTDEKLITAYPC